MPAVIAWRQKGLVPLGPVLTADPRCRLVEADFFALAADPAVGFDPAQPGRRFHAVLLDIDHSPDNLLHERHTGFYSVTGLGKLAAQLLPGGVFALWSDDPPEDTFFHDLAGLDLDPVAAGFNFVVSGHTHRPVVSERGGVTCINPGSCGLRRFKLPVSVAEIVIDGNTVTSRLIELEVSLP